jgi:hypothetical protein
MSAVAEDQDGLHGLQKPAHGPFVHLPIELAHQWFQKAKPESAVLLREAGWLPGLAHRQPLDLWRVGDYGILFSHNSPSFAFLSGSILAQAYHRRAPFAYLILAKIRDDSCCRIERKSLLVEWQKDQIPARRA